MRLHVLFILRPEAYPEQHAPEARLAWDEYCVDENPGGFDEACAKELAELGNDVQAHRVIDIHVDQSEIRSHLVENPKVEGKVVP